MRRNRLSQNLVSFVVGVLFAIGLVLSGMTQPLRILQFLDPWNWDPSLIFVMLGAVGVHALSYPFIRKRPSPLLDTHWHLPNRSDISTRLILGSALFGIGWGIGGYCPGPGLASLASGELSPFIFVVSMIVGMVIYKKISPRLGLRE